MKDTWITLGLVAVMNLTVPACGSPFVYYRNDPRVDTEAKVSQIDEVTTVDGDFEQLVPLYIDVGSDGKAMVVELAPDLSYPVLPGENDYISLRAPRAIEAAVAAAEEAE